MDTPRELNITEDELLKLLQADSLTEGEGVSTRELAYATNKTSEWVRKRLRRWWDEGKLVVSKKREQDMLGRLVWVPVYRLKKEDEEEHVEP